MTLSTGAYAARPARRDTPPYLALAILVLLYMLSAMDRQLVAILSEPIKNELRFSDTQLALLQGPTFALFYAVAGIPIAWLADRVSRLGVLGVSCLAWSALTAMCGGASSFAHLALLRMGVGIGEAGGTAPSLSLISDFFPPSKRGTATAIFTFGTPLGVIMGTSVIGWVGAVHGWRTAFFAAGAMGVVLVPLLLLIREPVRGRFNDGPSQAAMPAKEVVGLFRAPVIFLLTLNTGASALVGYALVAWTPAFLMRTRGMTLGELGLWYSPTVGIALAVGAWLGGYIVDRGGSRDKRIYAIVPATASLLAIPLLIGALLTTRWQISLPLIALPGLLMMLYFGPTMALLHNLVPASGRTMATSIMILVMQLGGQGCGPLLIGIVSDWLTPTYGHIALQMALYSLVPVLMLSTIGYLALIRAIGKSQAPGQTAG